MKKTLYLVTILVLILLMAGLSSCELFSGNITTPTPEPTAAPTADPNATPTPTATPTSTVDPNATPTATIPSVSGSIDTAFGLNGVGLVSSSVINVCMSITLDDSGNVYGVGTTKATAGGYTDAILFKLTSDGTADTTFEGGGITAFSHMADSETTGFDRYEDIILDSNGNLIVVGYSPKSASYHNHLILQRFTADGTADTTFGTDGKVVYTSGASGLAAKYNDSGYAVKLDSQDNIIISGTYDNAGSNVGVWKYDSTGTLVSSFGTSGVFDVDINSSDPDYGYDLVIDSNDNIYVVGTKGDFYPDYDYNVFVIKLTSSGSLDTSYGTDGKVTISGIAGNTIKQDEGKAVAIDSQGNIYITGYSMDADDGGNYDAFVVKVDSSGAVDTTFGTNGIALLDGVVGTADTPDFCYDIALDSNNNIIITGNAVSTDRYMYVYRLKPDGTADTTFATDGLYKVTGAAGGNEDSGYGLFVTADNTIYVCGYSEDASGNDLAAVWKLQ